VLILGIINIKGQSITNVLSDDLVYVMQHVSAYRKAIFGHNKISNVRPIEDHVHTKL